MRHWIFQGNPDSYPIDTYLQNNSDIVWTVYQKHLAKDMSIGDEVFLWRAAGRSKGHIAGVVAQGVLTSTPKEMRDDDELWPNPEQREAIELRVHISLQHKCLGSKEVVRRDWLKEDPVASQMRILKFYSETNYPITPSEAQRLAVLVRNTGRDWTREESIAGLWAYAHTLEIPVSRLPGSPVAEIALVIGRAVTGVYNKVMNFRAIDPTDKRQGLSAGGHTDASVWAEFFDDASQAIRISELDSEFSRLWGTGKPREPAKTAYKEFGDAPNDDPTELQLFAARVRRGQPFFRRNLLAAYGNKCALTGHGPSEVLEGVHIVPHASTGINELDNGLLMRADLHYLFDANLIRIDPSSLRVAIDATLQGTPYEELDGKVLRLREDGTQIGLKYLKQRWVI